MPIKKVLLVDDEPDIRKIASLALRAVGKFDVVIASSGEEALSLARQERPDAILLDVMMPEMDGPTTLTRLRADAELADIPVVFVTAKVQKHEVERLLALGAKGIITKPFDPMTLSADVRRALGEA